MKIIILWSVILFLFILCILLKRKIRFFSLLILTITVTFFQILTPNGKILFSIGNFNITLGSLTSGIFKSGILILLQLLSKLIVSLKINYDSKSRNFLTDVFSIYNQLTESSLLSDIKQNQEKKPLSKIQLNKNSALNFIKKLDQKLFSIWEQI